jgi:hypothetical protein
MPEERGVGDGAFGGGSRTGGNVGSVTASVGMRLDRTIARLWMTAYDDLTRKVRTLRTEIRQLNQEASRTTSAINGVSTGASASTTSTSNATNAAIVRTSNLVQGTGGAPSAGGGAAGAAGAAGGGGGGAGAALAMAGPYGAMASAAASVIKSQMDKVQQALAKMDARIDRGYTPALAADRQSVMYQQMYGVTQQQNYNQYRQPLNNYRLGDGGINQMLSLQASTGLNAQTMAPGVEAIRTISGFSLGTGDVTGMLQSLASPEVNNRLTMTLGTGLYGLGGKQRTPMEVIQKIVRGAGLTDPRVAETALQPGSTTRARLTAMGVPPEMHDTIIQYAMQNAQFQKKTGGKKGMYNPGDRAQLKTMGIAGNFATEREVSDVRRTQTDESFYNKQKDNFASMERNTQKMETLTRRIEELTSALTGARISTRGHPITRGLGKAFGSVMGPVNDLLGMLGGDPVESGQGSKVTNQPKGKGASTASHGLHNTFADRLNKMMMDRPGVSINQGFRSSSDQRTMFIGRYSRTSEKTGVFWDNSYWKKNNPSLPDAAPPGMSMHELGLAADLRFATKEDENWVQENAARYGIKTFGKVINEPWHVQPAELPNSRRQYEKDGAPWGRPGGATPFDESTTFEGIGDSTSYINSGLAVNSQLSIADSITYDRQANRMRLGGGGLGGRSVTLRTGSTDSASGGIGRSGKGTSRGTPGNIPAGFKYRTTPSYGGWGYFVPKSFSDADLEQLHLHEQKDWTRTVTNSDGTLMGGFAMNQYNWNRGGGKAYAANPALASPEDQKKVAKVLLDKFHAHDGFESIVRGNISWPGVGKLKSIDLPPNTPTTTKHGPVGDPMEGPYRGGGNKTVIMGGGGGNVTIAPNIYIQSTGNNVADAHRAAQEVADIISRKLKTATLRGM